MFDHYAQSWRCGAVSITVPSFEEEVLTLTGLDVHLGRRLEPVP